MVRPYAHRSWAIAFAVGAIVAAGAPAASAANSVSVSISPAKPVEGLPFTVTVSGETANSGPYGRDVTVSIRRPQSLPCSAHEHQADDPHADFMSYWDLPGGTTYSRSHTFTVGQDGPIPRGLYRACAWFDDYNNGSDPLVAMKSLAFSAREAHYSLKLGVPAHERASDPGFGGVRRPTKSYRATTNAEAPGGVLTVEVQERGVHKCARTPDGSKGQLGYTGLDDKKVKTGHHVYKHKGEVFEVGTFLVCGWIVDAMDHTVARAHKKVTVSP